MIHWAALGAEVQAGLRRGQRDVDDGDVQDHHQLRDPDHREHHPRV
jgi:hypothetical protein